MQRMPQPTASQPIRGHTSQIFQQLARAGPDLAEDEAKEEADAAAFRAVSTPDAAPEARAPRTNTRL